MRDSLPLNPDGTCPPKYTKRKAYFIEKSGTLVPARCIPSTNRGAPRTRKNCPPGKFFRAAYIRKYGNTVKREGYIVHREGKSVRIMPQVNEIRVPAACVDEQSPESPVPSPSSLQRGLLLAHGYNFRLTKRVRRDSLLKAVRVHGASAVYKQLAAVAKIFKRSKPEAARVFAEDRDWTKTTFRL
jgi:hypothetical protein